MAPVPDSVETIEGSSLPALEMPFISAAGNPLDAAERLEDLSSYSTFCAEDSPLAAEYRQIAETLRTAAASCRRLAELELAEIDVHGSAA